MHHLWRGLRERGDGVGLHPTKFNDARIAVTNGSNAIWIDDDLLQVERRCAVQHEQAHIDLGHTNCDDPKEESAARRLTANKLIDWDELVDVFRWAHTAVEAADELNVIPEVLEDRLRFLHPHEKVLLRLIGQSRNGSAMASIEPYETTKGRRYLVRYRKPDRKSTMRRGFRTKRAAQMFLNTVEVSKLEGLCVDPTAGRRTVAILGAHWLASQTRVKTSSKKVYETALRVHVLP